ncbi:type II toxin-antitoxin system RelE/ParE family toxin [Bradyrhizobium elkanii]|uniref:type II toxin-antitoxin system RelE/ParE family toxin n=1 Tax=Bradyrhizobium elkanii TaxID=29448 RepID=UPI0030B96170
MNVRYTRRAVVQIDRALSYIETRSPQGAVHVRDRILALVTLLQEQPRAGRPPRRPPAFGDTVSLPDRLSRDAHRDHHYAVSSRRPEAYTLKHDPESAKRFSGYDHARRRSQGAMTIHLISSRFSSESALSAER